jgi:hypothetical protein
MYLHDGRGHYLAVLVHIHPASDWIFAEIANRAKTLIVIEGESRPSGRKGSSPGHQHAILLKNANVSSQMS